MKFVMLMFLVVSVLFVSQGIVQSAPTDGDLCSQKCPADCGCLVTDSKANCHCTAENHPLIKITRPPPPPPPKNKREDTTATSDSDDLPSQEDANLCRSKCPADCGCLVIDGEANCRCTAENHPLIKTTPPPPPPPKNKREDTTATSDSDDLPSQEDANLCRSKCPADCGCLVIDGEANCRCSAENHPLIRTEPPTPSTQQH